MTICRCDDGFRDIKATISGRVVLVSSWIVAILFLFMIAIISNLHLKHRIEQQIPVGSSRSKAKSNMSSFGFACANYNPKSFDTSIGEELFCLKKEKIGPRVANNNWSFIVQIFPWLYAAVPKDSAASAMYRRLEVVLVLRNDVVSSVRVNTRLTPQ